MPLSCEMFFDWLRNCVQVKLLNLVQVALTKIPRNEAKIYQEMEFHSSEQKDIFLTSPGCCLAY